MHVGPILALNPALSSIYDPTLQDDRVAPLTVIPMSANTQETDPSISNFISIFKAASEGYQKLTKQNLDARPFCAEIVSCSSPADVLNPFRIQAETFEEFRKGDDRLMKWLDPIVNLLSKFSTTVAAGNALIVSFKDV